MVAFVRSDEFGGVCGAKCSVECIEVCTGCGHITVWFRDDAVLVSSVFFVVVVPRVPHQMRRSRFLIHLCKDGHALQPKGGEHVYLSSRCGIGPWGPASNRGMAPAVIFRVVRCGGNLVSLRRSESKWEPFGVAISVGGVVACA